MAILLAYLTNIKTWSLSHSLQCYNIIDEGLIIRIYLVLLPKSAITSNTVRGLEINIALLAKQINLFIQT
jgi:hypothetical protein